MKKIVYVIITLLFIVIGFKLLTNDSVDEQKHELSKNDYDYSLIQNNNGLYSYEDDNYTSEVGIDVSQYQGYIDWDKVSNNNLDFAFIRLGYRGYSEGLLHVDETYNYNIENANRINLKTGVYFFSQAINVEEAKEEAQFVIDNLNNYKIDMPIVYDLEPIEHSEHRTSNLKAKERTKIAKAFCDYLKNQGYDVMIYGNKACLESDYNLSEILDYDIWYAAYIDKPEFNYSFQIWQYSNEGVIDGINTNVDMNLYIKKR